MSHPLTWAVVLVLVVVLFLVLAVVDVAASVVVVSTAAAVWLIFRFPRFSRALLQPRHVSRIYVHQYSPAVRSRI